MMKIIKNIMKFSKEVSNINIAGLAAQGAYYMLLSLVPMVALILTLIKFTPIDFVTANKLILSFIPVYFRDFTKALISQIYNNSTLSTSFSIIVLLWSASKVMRVIVDGFNIIYGTKNDINYIKKIGYSLLYTIIMVLLVPIMFIIPIIGRHIYKIMSWIFGYATLSKVSLIIINIIGTSLIIFVILVFLYRSIPKCKLKFNNVAIGALFATVAWQIFSNLFSFYIDFTIEKVSIYGGLNIIILLMLWFYCIIFIVLMGCQINAYYFMKTDGKKAINIE